MGEKIVDVVPRTEGRLDFSIFSHGMAEIGSVSTLSLVPSSF